MCGIVGYISKDKIIRRQELYNATKLLQHRGPDKTNTWVSDDHLVGLGHTRLSIIDIENGTQPLFSQSKDIVIVVNGEFYGFKSIRSDLIKKGHKFSTESDSEILIGLYLEHGLNCLKFLNGEFSFILWDSRKKILFAARDRFGAKPLYFSTYDNKFIVASEIKSLLSLGISAEWNLNALARYLYGVPPQDITCFNKIESVKPGHFIIKTDKSFQYRCYWDQSFHIDKSIDDVTYISEFKNKLNNAVKTRLIADVPVGCYLSGGIDSSAIYSLAAQAQSNIEAFTICYDHADYNEYQYAKDVAGYYSSNLSTITVTQKDLADNYKDTIYFREAPVYQTSGIGKYLLSRFVRSKGLKAVLTGEGADEILAGYPSFKEDYLSTEVIASYKQQCLNLLKKESEKAMASYVSEGSYNSLEIIRRSIGSAPSFLKLSQDIAKYSKKVISNEHISNFDSLEHFRDSIQTQKLLGTHPVNVSMYLWSKSFFPELILSYLGDRVEMANSIEGRLPYLDSNLVEFTNKLPIHLKIKGMTEKFILREAVKDLIPQHIYKRTKHIYATPPAIKTTSNPMKALMLDIFASQKFKEFGLFNSQALIELLHDATKCSTRDNLIIEFTLNLALSTYYLADLYKIRMPSQ